MLLSGVSEKDRNRTKKMKKIRVGIIGAGWIVPYHIKGYQALGDKVEILAVADVSGEKARQLSKEADIKNTFTDYHDLLKLKQIDVVDICLPTHLHAEVVIAACEKGKHVLCEKPFAATVEDCDKMIEAAKRANVLLMPVHNCIFFPPILKAYKVLKQGEIGKPLIYRASHICGYPGGSIGYLKKNYRGEKAKGGGAIIEGGVHSIYIAERFMGRISEVSAKLTRFSSDNFDIENGGVVLLRFRSGAVGTITIYWGAGYGDDGKEMIGTKGAIIINGIEGQILRQPPLGIYRDPKALGHHVRDESQSWEFPYVDFDWNQSFTNIIAHFIDCIQDKKKPIVTAEDGRSAIKVVQAIYQSAKQGKCIKV